jgi:hypothetical protein
VTFGYVPPPFGIDLWNQLGELLDASVRRGGNDWTDVAEALCEQRAQLWIEERDGQPIAAMITRLDGDTFEVWLAGGKVINAIPHLETAISAAAETGASNGRITGRRGWARALRSYGWTAQGDDLVKRWA